MTSETSVLHKQNDTSRENSKPQYFSAITEPVLPNCRQVLWFICLCDYIQEVSPPTRGLPYYTLSALSFSCLLTVVLSGVVFVLFCFSNTENILVCLWIQLTFLCTRTDNIHLSQRMAYQILLIQIASEGAVPDAPGSKVVPPSQWAGYTPDRNTSDSKIWIKKPDVPPPQCITSA